MTEPLNKFKLPAKTEKLLASMSSFYAEKNLPLHQKLIVNSSCYFDVDEEQYFNGDEYTYGHVIHFLVPQSIYSSIVLEVKDLGDTFRQDMNQLIQSSFCKDEYICQVYFELQENEDLKSWRENTGVFDKNNFLAQIKNQEEMNKIWQEGFFKVFISHISKYKDLATYLKSAFLNYGVSCFVAHEDIEPTKEWQDEIEKALTSADALVPLLTEGFSGSRWTDQEIGIAIGQGIMILPVRFGLDPYGFIGKYQAISFKGKVEGWERKELDKLVLNIFSIMFDNDSTRDRIIDAMVTRIETSLSFDQTNNLMRYMSKIKKLPITLIDRLEDAYQRNSQVNGAFNAEKQLPLLIRKWRELL